MYSYTISLDVIYEKKFNERIGNHYLSYIWFRSRPTSKPISFIVIPYFV